MGLSEKDLCIKCDKGGKLLICSDIGCPIAVHENCLGCPARFDEMGNFNCPFCLCRQAMAELRQERENAMSKKKALSTFIDKEMMDHDKRRQKSANAKSKEQAQPITTDNAVQSSLNDNEKRVVNTDDEEMMDCDKRKQKSANVEAKEQAQLITTDKAVETSLNDNEKRVDNTDKEEMMVCDKRKQKSANAKAKERDQLITTVSAVKSSSYDNEKRVDNTDNKEMMVCDKRKQKSANAKAKERVRLITTVDAVKSSFYDNEKRVDNADISNHSVHLEDKEEEFAPKLRHKTKSTPIVACGRDDVSDEEDTVQQFEVVEVRQGVKRQLSRRLDDQKFGGDVEHQQENDRLSGSSVVEKKTSDSTGDYSESLNETESRSAEEEHVAALQHETSASSYEDESMPELHLEAQQGGEAQCRQSKRIKRTDEHKAQSYSVDFSRRSSPIVRRSSTEKKSASRKLRKPSVSQTNSPRNPFPHGRRTRLLWTEEEEDMLKEGVRIFSSTANKNLPWKKILEFGRHVFNSTRNPMDLKDKWRNILAKQD